MEILTAIPALLDVVAWLAACIYTAFVGNMLTNHLRKHKHERWRYLTSIGRFGPGMSNAIRELPYVWGSDDDEDDTIRLYKRNVRKGMLTSLLTWIGVLPLAYLSGILCRLLHSCTMSR